MSSLKIFLSYESIPQSKITYLKNVGRIPYFGVQIAQKLQKANHAKAFQLSFCECAVCVPCIMAPPGRGNFIFIFKYIFNFIFNSM